MSAPESQSTPDCFRLKGSMFTLSVIELSHFEAEAFQTQLQQTVNQAPRFFQHMPIVIGLDSINADADLNFAKIKQLCQNAQLNPVGIRGGSEAQQQAALEAGLPSLGNVSSRSNQSNSKTDTPEPAAANLTTKVIDRPIRSGQQIYARDAHLVVLAPVSAGAEILADGDIHVYAPLRGRALAGINGNTQARIYCQNMEAELLSIAGHYKLSEDLQHSALWKQSVQAILEDEKRLQLNPLG